VHAVHEYSEVHGAAVGLHIAERAEGADIRGLFASVTRDELGHAALSLRMQRWIRSRLTDQERDRVDAAMGDALTTASTRALLNTLAAPDDERLRHIGRAVHGERLAYFARAA
jgi:rubrerythrin